jgi:hypothetical protein
MLCKTSYTRSTRAPLLREFCPDLNPIAKPSVKRINNRKPAIQTTYT